MPQQARAAAGSILLVLFGALGAEAAEVRDAATGLRFQAQATGFRTCVVVPEAMWSEESCENVNREVVARMGEGGGHRRVALLIGQTGAAAIGVLVTAWEKPGIGRMDQRAVGKVIDGSLSGLRRHYGEEPEMVPEPGGARYAIQRFGPAAGFRYRVRVARPESGGAVEKLIYVVASDDSLIFFSFDGNDPASIAELGRFAHSLMWTVTAPSKLNADLLGQPSAADHRSLGESIGQLTAYAVVGGLLIGAVVLLVRSSKRRAPPAPPA